MRPLLLRPELDGELAMGTVRPRLMSPESLCATMLLNPEMERGATTPVRPHFLNPDMERGACDDHCATMLFDTSGGGEGSGVLRVWLMTETPLEPGGELGNCIMAVWLATMTPSELGNDGEEAASVPLCRRSVLSLDTEGD